MFICTFWFPCFQVCSRGLDIKDVTHVVNLDMVPWGAEDLGAEENKKRAMGNNCKHEIHRPQICIHVLYICIYLYIYICVYVYIYTLLFAYKQDLKRLLFFQSIMLCAYGKKDNTML